MFGPGQFSECNCVDKKGAPIPCDFADKDKAAALLCTGVGPSVTSTQATVSSLLSSSSDNSQVLESVSNFQQTESTDDSFNEPVESCSLEFYRSHASSADGPNSLWPAGYNPNDKFGYVAYFNSGITISSGEDPTLLQALHAKGDGINKLARQAVTALLNAANPEVDYHFSVTQVIDMTQRAIMSHDYSIADEFESYNVVDGAVLCQDNSHDKNKDDDNKGKSDDKDKVDD